MSHPPPQRFAESSSAADAFRVPCRARAWLSDRRASIDTTAPQTATTTPPMKNKMIPPTPAVHSKGDRGVYVLDHITWLYRESTTTVITLVVIRTHHYRHPYHRQPSPVMWRGRTVTRIGENKARLIE